MSIGISIIKIRRSHDRLLFMMEISMPGKAIFILNRGPDGDVALGMTIRVPCQRRV